MDCRMLQNVVFCLCADKKNHDSICGQIIIPKEVKERILKELKLFGISREILFADSVDIVCEEIMNTFKGKIRGEFCY